MKKKIILTAFAALLATLSGWAQVNRDRVPASEPNPTDKTEQVGNAKSKKNAEKMKPADTQVEGAESGSQGKGFEKGTRDHGKGEGKGKGKGKGKNKEKNKEKHKSKGQKNRPEADGEHPGHEHGEHHHGDKPDGQEAGGSKDGKTKPAGENGRRAGQKPTPGTEKKGN